MTLNTFGFDSLPADELIALEARRQSQSDEIISKLALENILSQFGNVHLVGAKGLGLMLAKDIDFSITVDTVAKDKWVELIKQLTLTPGIRHLTAIDYYNYTKDHQFNPEQGEHYSYYVSLNKLSDEELKEDWEVQIHYQPSSAFDNNKLAAIQSKVTAENKPTAIRLKLWADKLNTAIKDRTNGNAKISSAWIYEAVLDKNVSSISGFYEFLRQENKLEGNSYLIDELASDNA